jgi:hypothetical protein
MYNLTPSASQQTVRTLQNLNSKLVFITIISETVKGRPETNTVNGMKCGLVKDTYSNLATWRCYFSQLINVHRVCDIWQN